MLIFVKGASLDAIRSGRKTATIRLWRSCKLQAGDPLSFNGHVSRVITRVVRCTVDTLSASDAHAAGFPSRAACRAQLRALYPAAAVDAPCVVLHFRGPS